jgi:hypothetical protein
MEAVETPWRHIRYAGESRCPYLHNHLFDVISPRTPIGQFIPSRCQRCWKIVIRPKTVKALFALENLLLQLNWPSKCGIERRAYTPLSKYLYGGYIYNESQEEGLQRLVKLREILDGHPELKGTESYLKRSCTEMEIAFPDSTKWEVTDEQIEIERILDWLIVFDFECSLQAQHVIDYVHKKWVEWAAQHGDETYLEYTDGQPMYLPAVRYEPRVEGTDEDTPDDETVSISPSSREVSEEIAVTKTKEKKK